MVTTVKLIIKFYNSPLFEVYMSKNIILILGNADLDLGRKTSYKDFYQSDFCPKLSCSNVQHLNKKWPMEMV